MSVPLATSSGGRWQRWRTTEPSQCDPREFRQDSELQQDVEEVNEHGYDEGGGMTGKVAAHQQSFTE